MRSNLMCKRKVVATLVVMLLQSQFTGAVLAQSSESEGGNTAESFSFNLVKAQGGGTFSGDVELSLPLLIIPGRGGLDFPINLNYQSGIRVHQKASWVGLGFNMQIGSVTRNVIHKVDDQKSNMFGGTLSYPNFSGFNIDTDNTSGDESDGLLRNYSPNEVWDDYFLHFPRGSHRIVPIPDENYSIPFYTERWQPWVIGYNYDLQNDVIYNNCGCANFDKFIDDFIVITEDGTRYLFGHPVYLKVNNDTKNIHMKFPIRWDLTAVLSPDYVDVNDNLIPDDADEGSWIRITYTDPEEINHKQYHAVSLGFGFTFGRGAPEDADLLYEYSYVDTIETPTHLAEFINSDRDDYKGFSNKYPNKLDKIILKSKVGRGESGGEDEEVSRIEFTYATGVNDDDGIWEANEKLKDDDLTLLEVQEIDAASLKKPSYKFTYKSNPAYGNTPGLLGYDIDERTAWCLETIDYPEGGVVTYEYEDDEYKWGFNVDGSGPASDIYKAFYDGNGFTAGGPRLLKKTVQDSMGNAYEHNYTYGDGVMNNLNPVDQNWNYGLPNKFAKFVGYRWVKEKLPGGAGFVKTYFTSGVESDANKVDILNGTLPSVDSEEMQPDVYNTPTSHIYTNSAKRGMIWKQEFLDADGSTVVRKLDNDYSYDTKYIWLQDTLNVNWHRLVNQTIWAENQSEQIQQDGITRTTEFTYDTTYGLPTVIKETNSAGEIRTRDITYAYEEYGTGTGNMEGKNLLSQQFMSVIYDGNAAAANARSASKTTWKQIIDPHNQRNYYKWYPASNYQWREDGPTYNFTGQNDPQFVLLSTAKRYDVFGNVVETADANGLPTTIMWGYKSTLPIAQFPNVAYSGAGPQDPPLAATGIFDDNFNDLSTAFSYEHYGNVKADWEGGTGTWTIGAGYYKQTSTTSSWTNPRRLKKVSMDDMVLEADIYFLTVGTTKNAGLVKYVSSSNFVRFELKQTGSTVKITARKNGQEVSSSEPSKSLNTNQWYHVRGEIQGSEAKLYVDGELLLTWDHANVDLGNGKLGLCTDVNRVNFDNASIYPPYGLATTTTYDPLVLQPSVQTDESGISIVSRYDLFGRLKSMEYLDEDPFREVSFTYSRQGTTAFDPDDPNYIEVKDYRGSGDSTVTRSYFDGIGRSIQTQIRKDSTYDVVQHTTYDGRGLVQRTYKPFLADTDHAYLAISGFPPDTLSQLTEYETNVLNRANRAVPFGGGASNDVSLVYGSEAFDGTSYRFVQTTTENEVKRKEYFDKFANRVAVIEAEGVADSVKIRFAYDIQGNLLYSVAPEGDTTKYSYNSLSQLIEKESPDFSSVEYLYDKSGNLRFQQDAVQGTSKFTYFKYDSLNRVIVEGQYTTGSAFTQANADDVSWPTSTGTTWKTYSYYDTDYIGVGPNYSQGRLTKVEVNTDTDSSVELTTKYKYDEFGNVVEKRDTIHTLSEKITKFEYDRQGNLTKTTYPSGTIVERTYNQQNQLDRVKTP